MHRTDPRPLSGLAERLMRIRRPLAVLAGLAAIALAALVLANAATGLGPGLRGLPSWWLMMAALAAALFGTGHWIGAPLAGALAALFLTLLMVVFIGEAVREAFDPKVFSRLR